MATQKKYFKIWVHVEEITLDEEGKESDYQSLDEEFMPVSVAICMKKRQVQRIMSAAAHFEAISLLLSTLTEPYIDSDQHE